MPKGLMVVSRVKALLNPNMDFLSALACRFFQKSKMAAKMATKIQKQTYFGFQSRQKDDFGTKGYINKAKEFNFMWYILI